MQCAFLTGNDRLSCKALKEVYIPSTFELDEYCRQDRYKLCPFYLISEFDKGVIFVDDDKAASG